jgi:PAS domain-containing protein
VLEALNLPVSLITPQYTYKWVNSWYSAAQGKKPEEIIGRTVRDLWGETFDKTIRVISTAASKARRCGPRHGSGTAYGPATVKSSIHHTALTEESALSAIVVAYDTTDRKEMEDQLKAHEERFEKLVRERTEALRKSEEKFRTIYESATEGFSRSPRMAAARP